MKNILTLALAIAAGLTSFEEGANAQNLIQNGDFEYNSNAATGWSGNAIMNVNVFSSTNYNNQLGLGNYIGPFGVINNFFTTPSLNGNFFWLSGADYSNPSYISQSFSTIQGQQYQLSFNYFNQPLSSQVIFNGTINGNVVFTSSDLISINSTLDGNDPANYWNLATFKFTATSSSSTLTITDGSNGWFGGVDNVSVTSTAVPEPSALSLLAVGLGGLVLVGRRRS
jgi:hypothetical protein